MGFRAFVGLDMMADGESIVMNSGYETKRLAESGRERTGHDNGREEERWKVKTEKGSPARWREEAQTLFTIYVSHVVVAGTTCHVLSIFNIPFYGSLLNKFYRNLIKTYSVNL